MEKFGTPQFVHSQLKLLVIQSLLFTSITVEMTISLKSAVVLCYSTLYTRKNNEYCPLKNKTATKS